MPSNRIKDDTFEVPSSGALIPSLDKSKQYPVDLLRELYIHSDKALGNLAEELGLAKSTLERLARSGAQSWHDAKKEIQKQRVESFKEVSRDILVERQSLAQRLETLTLMEIRLRLQEIEEHFSKHGHFYMVNEEGEIVKDGKGQAIRLTLPNGQKDLLTLKALEDLRLNNQNLLDNRLRLDAEEESTIATKRNVISGLFEAEE